jgi:hypothetical protein
MFGPGQPSSVFLISPQDFSFPHWGMGGREQLLEAFGDGLIHSYGQG